LKQCAGCGKHYDEGHATCPSCWSRGWVRVPEGEASAVLPANSNPCPECGYMAAAGVPRCPHCKARLRPRAMEWLCLLGIVGCPVAFIVILLRIVSERNFWDIVNLVLCGAFAVACWGLLRGRYAAWRRMRALLIGAPALLLALIGIAEILKDYAQASAFAGTLVLLILAGLPLWFVLHSQRVQDYAAVGKPKEVYTPHELFPEKTRLSREQRLGSRLTRNL